MLALSPTRVLGSRIMSSCSRVAAFTLFLKNYHYLIGQTASCSEFLELSLYSFFFLSVFCVCVFCVLLLFYLLTRLIYVSYSRIVREEMSVAPYLFFADLVVESHPSPLHRPLKYSVLHNWSTFMVQFASPES